jgi:hypothetical protein
MLFILLNGAFLLSLRQIMKKVVITLLALAMTAGVSAQEQQYTLKTGDVSMTVDANGGKILSFKLGDAEVINQSRFPNSFGSTFWTSPQSEWNWPPVPEYDRLPYTVEAGEKLVMTSQVSERMKYRITKTFTPNDADHSISVTYTIKNEGDAARKVAPWEITRVPNDGIIFFDAPLDGITPAGLMNFTSAHDLSWYVADEAPQNRKVNADGKGWLAYCAKGLLLVKQFQDLDASQPAPNEAEIQVYVNMRKTYIEIESQGAYTELKPGEQLQWTVRWHLLPFDGNPEPSDALANKIKGIR